MKVIGLIPSQEVKDRTSTPIIGMKANARNMIRAGSTSRLNPPEPRLDDGGVGDSAVVAPAGATATTSLAAGHLPTVAFIAEANWSGVILTRNS